MKKILTILLVSLMVLSLTGCNSKKEETVKVEEPVVQETVKEETPVVEEKPTVEETDPVEVVEEVKEEKADVTTLSYWVNFLNPDGTVVSRKAYKYGETPKYPTETPTYFDGVAYYAFREWDKKLSPVHMTQTYKALYDVTGYVKSNDDRPSAPTPTLSKKTIDDVFEDNYTMTLYFKYSEQIEGNSTVFYTRMDYDYVASREPLFLLNYIGYKYDGEEEYHDSSLVAGEQMKEDLMSLYQSLYIIETEKTSSTFKFIYPQVDESDCHIIVDIDNNTYKWSDDIVLKYNPSEFKFEINGEEVELTDITQYPN